MEDIFVDLDQKRRLFIGIKEAKALSKVCGGGLYAVNRKLAEFDIETLERVLWAALSRDEPSVTINLTAKRVEAYYEREGTLSPLFVLAGEAISASGMFNPLKEPTEGNETAAPAA